MQHFELGAVATVLYAVLEPGLAHARMSSAGHIPPPIAVPGQPARLADIPPGLMIGVAPGRTGRHMTIVDIPPGALLCMCTDGLIERREQPVDDGLARLCQALKPEAREAACSTIMAAMVGADWSVTTSPCWYSGGSPCPYLRRNARRPPWPDVAAKWYGGRARADDSVRYALRSMPELAAAPLPAESATGFPDSAIRSVSVAGTSFTSSPASTAGSIPRTVSGSSWATPWPRVTSAAA